MPALRAALADAGFANVRTYVQSGNIVLDSDLSAAKLAAAIGDLLAADFELKIQARHHEPATSSPTSSPPTLSPST